MHVECGLFLLVFLFQHIRAQDECGCTEVMRCPPNSNTTGFGAASVDDCVCYPGYMRLGEECVAECPPNSTTAEIGCTCVDGFVASGGGCVEMFRCPANSRPVGGGLVLSSVDCWCNEGFVRSDGGLCVCAPNSVISSDGCVCVSGYNRTFANESCVQAESSPVALITGAAVGGGAVLVGVVWAVVRYIFMAPAVSPPPMVSGGGMLAQVRMTRKFIEYKV